MFDPDGLETFFTGIRFTAPGNHQACYQTRDIELFFYAVSKPFREIEHSEQWEKILGLAFGICYSILAVAQLLLMVCHCTVVKSALQPDDDIKTFAGTRRAFHSVLLVAGLEQLFLDDTDSTRFLYLQLSRMLFRKTSSQFGSMANGPIAGRQSLIGTIGGVFPSNPVSDQGN